jgi:adenosylcobinamide kinase/adenosylcobinamide-phosphate guanylyltransferase
MVNADAARWRRRGVGATLTIPQPREMSMSLTLVLGGARSGKSRYAQQAAEAGARARGVTPTFIATATAGDAEMSDRIARHQADRDGQWRTLEAPLALAEVLAGLGPKDVAVVDCLTLWLSNSMFETRGHDVRVAAIVPALATCEAQLWLVSNEVGWGIVPDNALARAFRDAAGGLHQRIASVADEVVLVVAGLPLALKPATAPT